MIDSAAQYLPENQMCSYLFIYSLEKILLLTDYEKISLILSSGPHRLDDRAKLLKE